MKLLKLLLAPFGFIYWLITSFRNWLYEKKIKRSLSFSLPIINVGNLSMGGTGKTPHIEMLIRQFKSTHHVATLSRGYGRKVYGFQLAGNDASARTIGDEPFQFYRKYGKEISVAVDADRVNGVSEICLQVPEVSLVLLDDAYQHRKIQSGLNILLTDYNKPFFDNHILPVGTLRESSKGKNRADLIIVTKCPENILENVKKEYFQKIKPRSHQKVFFSRIKYGDIKPLTNFSKSFPNKGDIVLVTGIAKPQPLVSYLSKTYNIVKHFKFPDHYQFKESDIDEIHNLLTKFATDPLPVITTEKDAMRLLGDELKPKIESKPWYYQEIEVVLDKQDDFNEIVETYVQENSRDY